MFLVKYHSVCPWSIYCSLNPPPPPPPCVAFHVFKAPRFKRSVFFVVVGFCLLIYLSFFATLASLFLCTKTYVFVEKKSSKTSLSVCLSVCLPVSHSLSPSPSVCVCLSVCLPPSLPLSLSLSLSRSLSHPLSYGFAFSWNVTGLSMQGLDTVQLNKKENRFLKLYRIFVVCRPFREYLREFSTEM